MIFRRRSPFSPRRRARRPRWLLRLSLLLALGLGLGYVALVARPWTVRGAVEAVRYRSHIHRVESHAEAIRFAARESRIDPNLIAAVMLSESGGRVDAVSSATALGLLQLALPTAIERARVLRLEEPTREDLLSDPLLNTRLGANYLKWLERYYDGHLEKMLIGYNAGPGRLRGWMRAAGGYEAWREERLAAGNSDVLRYAAKVLHFREVFARRGAIAPLADHPPAPQAPPLEPEGAAAYGPPRPDSLP